MKKIILFVMACAWASWACANALPDSIYQQMRLAGLPPSSVSFFVSELTPESQARLAYRENVPMNPASVMKLVTTFAALDLLGPHFTWKTRFLTQGQIENGTLKGALIIQGGGDPKWVVERIAHDIESLKAKGLTAIQGDVILDRTVFDLPFQSPSLFDGEGARPYNATPDGLLVNFKAPVVTLSAEPGASAPTMTVSPPVADLTIRNNVTFESGNCDERRTQLTLEHRNANALVLSGTVQPSCGPKRWSFAFIDPENFAPRVLKAMLMQAGISIGGSVRFATTPQEAHLLHEGQSLPLYDIIADVNKFSNNVMARHVFLTLASASGNRHALSLPKAQDAASVWWRKTFGTRFDVPVFDNGSGLSRSERISAAALSDVLLKAHQHRDGAYFHSSLGVVGVDEGTAKRLAAREALLPLLGRATLKTGTLNDVKAIAGYVTGQSGRSYRVVALVNHAEAGRTATPVLDAFLRWVVEDQNATQTQRKMAPNPHRRASNLGVY